MDDQKQCAQCGCGRPAKDMRLVCMDCVEKSRRFHKTVETMQQHHRILVAGLQDEIDKLNTQALQLTEKLAKLQTDPTEPGGNGA